MESHRSKCSSQSDGGPSNPRTRITSLTEFELTCPPETALKKLAKAQIPVYKLKKSGAKLHFAVNEEYIEKVFAIFAHPCYNIGIRRKSAKARFLSLLKIRSGLIVGAALFTLLALLSQTVVFKIKIIGSADYLKGRVMQIARECGASELSACKGFDKPLFIAKTLSLEGVSFCSVQRRGAYLIIDVRTSTQDASYKGYSPMLSTAEGVITKIVVISGTQTKAEGEKVKKGEALIAPYFIAEDGAKTPCLAVGFAEVEVSATISLFYKEESERNMEDALSSTALYSERVTQKSCKVKSGAEGVTYEVTFRYLITIASNME